MINVDNLISQNPWWQKETIQLEEAGWVQRDLYFQIEEELADPFMINILGLRRVGKSSLTKQLIAKLLKSKTPPKNIFYFLFDFSHFVQKPEVLTHVLQTYFDQILQKKIYDLKNRVYVFLDEIQFIENWQAVLKRWYDISGKRIKFVITGSQSLVLKNKSHESLSGRIFDRYLPPLCFQEFLKIKKEKLKPFPKFDLFNLKKDFLNLRFFNENNQRQLENLGREYLSFGQFPECLGIKKNWKKQEYIKESILGRIFEDIFKIYKIEKTEEFKIVAYYFFHNASSIFNLENAAQNAGLQFLTVDSFLKYMESAYLLQTCFKKYRSIIKKGRSLKKIYSTSTNFSFALSETDPLAAPEIFGKIVENQVFNSLKKSFSQVFFWRKREEEIDFLISRAGRTLPIEVKIQNRIEKNDLKTILKFCEEKKIKEAIIFSKNKLEMATYGITEIFFLPYYFVLMI